MRVNKNLITAYRPFLYEGPLDPSKWEYRPGYGVKAFKSCDCDVEIYLEQDEYSEKESFYADVYATATLLRTDSRTLEEYEEKVEIEENVEILSSILDEGEGYVFPEHSFELEDLIFAMILSSLPTISRREESALPEGGEGYDVYEEGSETDDGVLFLSDEDQTDE